MKSKNVEEKMLDFKANHVYENQMAYMKQGLISYIKSTMKTSSKLPLDPMISGSTF